MKQVSKSQDYNSDNLLDINEQNVINFDPQEKVFYSSLHRTSQWQKLQLINKAVGINLRMNRANTVIDKHDHQKHKMHKNDKS